MGLGASAAQVCGSYTQTPSLLVTFIASSSLPCTDVSSICSLPLSWVGAFHGWEDAVFLVVQRSMRRGLCHTSLHRALSEGVVLVFVLRSSLFAKSIKKQT